MKKINWQRVFLITLVSAAFCGFLLFSIKQNQAEIDSIYSQAQTIKSSNPLENNTIKVAVPKLNSSITSPATISGQAKVLASRLRVRIKDAKNIVLAERYVQTANASKMSAFSIALNFIKTSSTKGTIEVYRINPPATKELDKIIIPVTFK